MTTINASVRTLSFAFAMFFVLASIVVLTPVKVFADDNSYDYSGGDYSTPSYDYSGGNYSTPSYDYSGGNASTPSYDYSGGNPSYSTGGYTTGGYSTGGYSTGGGYMIGGGGGYSVPVASSGYSNTYAPTTVTTNTNNNSCTGNSCNTNITNPAPVINNNNVVANYAQPVATSYPTQQYCQNGYSGTYPNCYYNQPQVYQQPVAYRSTPYVSLSQVPYTGLDLGFWGSIAYWGAFVLFALFAAYLIAIKRVQNTIALYLKAVLFGTDETEEEVAAPVATPVAHATAPAVVNNGDMIDSFIMSQINRARRA